VTAETWAEIGRMARAGGIVAAFAVPFGLVMAAVVHRRHLSLLPRWKPWRVPWGGFEVLLVFVVVQLLVPLSLVRSGIVAEQAALAAFPIQLALLFGSWRVQYPRWRLFRRDVAVLKSDTLSLDQPLPIGTAFARAMTLATLAWLVLTPTVLVIHGFVNWIFTQMGRTPEQHPITNLARGEGWGKLSFLLQACLIAPVIEEVVFRGILLAWMVGGRERNTGGLRETPIAPSSARPLIVMVIAAGMILVFWILARIGGGDARPYPVIFALVLTVGLFLLWVGVRRGRRHVLAVYVSAAVFGLVHSGVWPTPIPLFFLGLGLGWLAVRTRGIFVPIVVHGLFNAVSAVYVLRSAA